MKKCFDDGWRFHDGDIAEPSPTYKGPAYGQAKTEERQSGPFSVFYPDMPDDFGSAERIMTVERWERVDLPHDCVIRQTPRRENNNAWGFFDYHPVFYRKHFRLSREECEDKRIVLYFEGVADRCTVYFNGSFMTQNREGHTPFEVDITDFVRFDADNVLAIRVECGTGNGWWYQGGGIYRHVWLELNDPVSIDRYGVYVAPRCLGENLWEVPVEVTVRNDGFAAADAALSVAVEAGDGQVLAVGETRLRVPAQENGTATLTLSVQSPARWDVDAPVLHTAVTAVTVDGEITDTRRTDFGFRTLEFTPDRGFFLNGRHLRIKGVCGHGDYGITGIAVPDSVYRHKAKLIREMGGNAYRCSHYTQAEYWMDEMDRQGILVRGESRLFSSDEDGKRELATLVKRDRNHPCVFLWSIGNEEANFIREQGHRIARTLAAVVKKYDTTRPVIVANDRTPEQCTVYDDCDLIGVNYNSGKWDMIHEQYPQRAMLSTENCATGTSRGWYAPDVPALGRISSFDHDTDASFWGRSRVWQAVLRRPWMMGVFQWIAFDHRGEAIWPRLSSGSGSTDMYLLRKDAFYQNRALWSDEPNIHLLPHWNRAHQAGKPVAVWAYTNAPETELFLNGESCGRRCVEPGEIAKWEVPFAPGKLEAVAYRDGEEVARDSRETTGRPVALRLRAENAADVRPGEVLLLTCTATDEQGREVPDAAPTVEFFTDGRGVVLGTGSDNTDPTPPDLPRRRMYAGAIAVAVRLANDATGVTVTALADGLTGVQTEFTLG